MEHIIEGPLISFSEISLSVSPTALSPVALTSPHRTPSQQPQQQQQQQTTQLPNLGTSILSSTPLGQQQQQAQISPTSAAAAATASSSLAATNHTTSSSTISAQRTNLTSAPTASPSLTNSASTGSISIATHSPLQRRSSGIYLNSGISIDPFGHVTSGGGSGGGIGKVANFQPQHRRSTSETTSSAISEQLSSSSGSGHHSSQEGEQTRTQSLILIGLYDDPTSKTVLIDGVPMDWRSSSTQQHFDFFYEEVFQEMTKFGIVEDLVICENFFLEFRSSVFVKFNSTKAASVAFDNLSNSRYFGGRKVETRFCPVVDFNPRTCLDFDNSSCPRGNMCPLMHIRRPSNHVHLRLQEVQKALLSFGIEKLNRMVHVRPLPRTLLENDLRSQLESFGKISGCCILEEDSGGPVCSAFIEFESEQAVKQTLANDGKSNIRLTTPSGSTPAQIIPMNGVMRSITNWTSQKGGGGVGGGFFLNATPPTISWDDSVLIARLPPKVGQVELKDFISSTISRHLGLEQTSLTGSGNTIANQDNTKNLVTNIKIDSKQCTAIVKFSTTDQMCFSYCLHKVMFRDYRLRVSRLAVLSPSLEFGQQVQTPSTQLDQFIFDLGLGFNSRKVPTIDPILYTMNKVKRLLSVSAQSSRSGGSNTEGPRSPRKQTQSQQISGTPQQQQQTQSIAGTPQQTQQTQPQQTPQPNSPSPTPSSSSSSSSAKSGSIAKQASSTRRYESFDQLQQPSSPTTDFKVPRPKSKTLPKDLSEVKPFTPFLSPKSPHVKLSASPPPLEVGTGGVLLDDGWLNNLKSIMASEQSIIIKKKANKSSTSVTSSVPTNNPNPTTQTTSSTSTSVSNSVAHSPHPVKPQQLLDSPPTPIPPPRAIDLMSSPSFPRPAPAVLLPRLEEVSESLISFESTSTTAPPPPPPPPPVLLRPEEPLIWHQGLTSSDEASFQELDLGDNEIDYNDLQIIQQIGEGGYGTVKSATWRGKMVAVKQLRLNNTDTNFLKKFRKEVAILSKLRHPNILLFMAVTKPPNICLVTEFLSRSMWEIIHNPKIVLSVPFLFKNAKGIALGLNYLHLCDPAIIHRDLKSPNLMLDEGQNIKVCDFGLSRIKQAAGVMTGRIGTPAWTAPEVLRNKPYSEKADVYSYGVVLFEFFSRQVPFPNMEPIQIAMAVVNGKMRPPVPPNCPPSMAKLMQDCWDEDPDKRPSFSEILERLEQMSGHFVRPQATTNPEGLIVL